MASGIGPSPFSGGSIDVRNESEVGMLRRGHKQRMGRSSMHSRGEEKRGHVVYNDKGLAQSSGYWKRPARPALKTLTDSLGNIYYTPDVVDWDDWVDMFHIKPEGKTTRPYEDTLRKEDIRSLADLCNWSFDRPSSDYRSFGCHAGHIERVDYHNSSKIMRVKFRSGGGETACYFYVPAQVYATLQNLSFGMPTRIGKDGKPRHLVGIYFWDLIRVRGTVHGNRYECCYVSSGDGGGLAKAAVSNEQDAARILEDNAARKMGIASNLDKDGQPKASSLVADSAREDAAMAAEIYKRGKSKEAQSSFNARIGGKPDASGLYKLPGYSSLAARLAREARAYMSGETDGKEE